MAWTGCSSPRPSRGRQCVASPRAPHCTHTRLAHKGRGSHSLHLEEHVIVDESIIVLHFRHESHECALILLLLLLLLLLLQCSACGDLLRLLHHVECGGLRERGCTQSRAETQTRRTQAHLREEGRSDAHLTREQARVQLLCGGNTACRASNMGRYSIGEH